MKIRSITVFINPGLPLDESVLEAAGKFMSVARPMFIAAGYEVQTTRLVTVPFSDLVPSCEPGALLDLAGKISHNAAANGFEYVSLGPALPEVPASYSLVPELLAVADNLFLSGMLVTSGRMVSLPAVRACAEIIQRVSQLSPDGFANLRFAALANVNPGAPFLPAGYTSRREAAGGRLSFALALESADLAVEAVDQASSLAEVRQNLIQRVESHAQALGKICEELVDRFHCQYGGLDFSLAPFPDPEISFGTALERLGVPAVGLHGSLAGAAFLMSSLDQAQYPRAGFNGLMLPLLEDPVIATRAAEGILDMKDLLLYSAVCGTGLDTIPLPGDTSQEQLAAILLDVAALALRLNKPLTARLMPLPGKVAGEPIHFDFAYFADSRVLGVEARGLGGLLTGKEDFEVPAIVSRIVS